MTRTPPEAGRAAAGQARERSKPPVPLPCNAPGKKRFLVDSHEFEVDDQYEVRRDDARGLSVDVTRLLDGLSARHTCWPNTVTASRTC
jgi:hypothetical protein